VLAYEVAFARADLYSAGTLGSCVFGCEVVVLGVDELVLELVDCFVESLGENAAIITIITITQNHHF
jgi:hypothetical protein